MKFLVDVGLLPNQAMEWGDGCHHVVAGMPICGLHLLMIGMPLAARTIQSGKQLQLTT